MGKYRGYGKYKASGVEWLGEIPEHWQMIPFKFLIDTRKGVAFKSSDFIDTGCLVVKASDIKNYSILESNIYLDPSLKQEYPKAILKQGEIVLSTVGSIPDVRNSAVGQVGIVPKNLNECLLNQNTVVFKPQKKLLFNKFLFYILISNRYRDHLDLYAHGTANQASLNITDMLSFQSAIPPLDEQQAIARFLDYKTKQIDDLIAKKETLIEKLDEKRTALISHAVTKGLDPNVPMKDSGIEWLGEIPESWKAVRLKHITSRIIDGAHFTPTYVDEGIPFLRVTDIVQAKNNSIDMNNIKFIPEEEHKILSIRCKPEQGDLLYSKNGTIGVSRIIDWDFEFSIFVSLCLIKLTKEKVNVEFLQYSLLGKLTETQISIGAKSNTVTNLHLDKIKEFLISLPTLDEQRKIIQYLDQKTNEIDQQKAKIQEAIELLKEYRTALIANAVTGKIDVRQVPIP